MHEDMIGRSADNVGKARVEFERRRNELNRWMMRLPLADRREHWKYYLVQLAESQKVIVPIPGEFDGRLRPVGESLQKRTSDPMLKTQNEKSLTDTS